LEGQDIGYLWTDNWNDWWKYQTLYVLTYFDDHGTKHEIGALKIGQFNMPKEQTRPDLPSEFENLDNRFFSLGQDVSYYTEVIGLGENISSQLLIALRDVVADQELFHSSLDEDVMGVSLLRSVTTRSVEGQFRRILDGGAALTQYSFRYEGPTLRAANVDRLFLEFLVTPESTPPTNIHVLIGRNGVGKTYLLNSMTRALVDPEGDPAAYGIFTSTDNLAVPTRESPFANIVSVTFSAFNDFTLLPERRNVSRGVR
jgi:hypothetical protein